MEFLKSLVLPLKMRRFREMSGFISVAIFLLATYLVIIPIRIRFNNLNTVINQNQYLTKNFSEATTDYDYALIKANNYAVDTKEAKLTADTEEVKVFNIVSTYNGQPFTFNFVFDLTNSEFKQDKNLYETYNIELQKDSCVILFASNFYELQGTKEEDVDGVNTLKSSTIQGATYKGCSIDFNSYNNTGELLDGVAFALARLYADAFIAASTFTSALMVFLIPLVLILVMWLVGRKNGSLKRFKEYFNIASICTIIPVLITFGIAWFYPQVINFYATAFVLYYLVSIYRINAFPLDYNPHESKA